MPRKTARKNNLCVRFTKETRTAIKRIAAAKDIPEAQVVRTAIKELIERNRQATAPAEL